MTRTHDWLGFSTADARAFVRASTRGFEAPSLGEAFFEGYQAALLHLFPDTTPDVRGALAVTEEGGNHPRAILTELVPTDAGYSLRGQKTFVTGAPRATDLFVVAREGERADGTPKLRVVRVSRGTTESAWPLGVSIRELPKTPFAPEIPHCSARFDDAAILCSAVLAGDGYLEFVKPFRTVEDIFVMAAIAAYLVSFLRDAVDLVDADVRIERLLGVIASLDALSTRSASAPGVHLALAGSLASMRLGLEGIEPVFDAHPSVDRARDLRRDLALLRVAESARRARREGAMRALRGATT